MITAMNNSLLVFEDGAPASPLSVRERGSTPKRGRHSTTFCLILSESSACQVPICAVAA